MGDGYERSIGRAGRIPRWLVLLVEVALLLAIATSLAVASGWLHAKGLM